MCLELCSNEGSPNSALTKLELDLVDVEQEICVNGLVSRDTSILMDDELG